MTNDLHFTIKQGWGRIVATPKIIGPEITISAVRVDPVVAEDEFFIVGQTMLVGTEEIAEATRNAYGISDDAYFRSEVARLFGEFGVPFTLERRQDGAWDLRHSSSMVAGYIMRRLSHVKTTFRPTIVINEVRAWWGQDGNISHAR